MRLKSDSTTNTKRLNDSADFTVGDKTLESTSLINGFGASVPTLTFLSGDALGKEIAIIHRQVTIGRGDGSDIILQDPSVSRRHIRLTCRGLMGPSGQPGMRVVLQDLDSRNGTFINCRRVKRAVLRPGDKIVLGRVILKYEHRDMADQRFYGELTRLATTDGLTSLLNKGAITKILRDELSKRLGHHRRLSVLLVDLDDFKCVNDHYGHLMGDKVLKCTAGVLRRNMRRQDRIGRFGGEEFLAVLPRAGLDGAAKLAERLRKDVEESVACELGIERRITASIGAASYPTDGLEPQNLLDNADNALYQAKARGKNRVVLWKPDIAKEIGD